MKKTKEKQMKKTYLLITIIMLCLSTVAWAGGYEDPVQNIPLQDIVIMPQENPKHWYMEMVIGGGTLLLGAIGLWLKYKKK